MFKFINNSTNKITEEKQSNKESLIKHEINIESIDLVLVSSDIKNNDKIKEKEDTYDDIDVDKIC